MNTQTSQLTSHLLAWEGRVNWYQHSGLFFSWTLHDKSIKKTKQGKQFTAVFPAYLLKAQSRPHRHLAIFIIRDKSLGCGLLQLHIWATINTWWQSTRRVCTEKFCCIQKPPGHDPGQAALGGPAWVAVCDQMTSRRSSFPSSTILWLHETP